MWNIIERSFFLFVIFCYLFFFVISCYFNVSNVMNVPSIFVLVVCYILLPCFNVSNDVVLAGAAPGGSRATVSVGSEGRNWAR